MQAETAPIGAFGAGLCSGVAHEPALRCQLYGGGHDTADEEPGCLQPPAVRKPSRAPQVHSSVCLTVPGDLRAENMNGPPGRRQDLEDTTL